MPCETERLTWDGEVSELRLVDAGERAEGGASVLEGYAAPFDKWSVDLFGFKERIAPGAFADDLKKNPDVRALVDHDSSKMLGRTKAGTLVLEEDKKGLKARITPPDTTVANDLMENIRLRNITQMSFGFQTVEDEWNEKFTERTLKKVKLFDVSVVTFPAYRQTSIKVRSALEAAGIDEKALARLFERANRGLPIEDEDEAAARAVVRQLIEAVPSLKAAAEMREKIAGFLLDTVKSA